MFLVILAVLQELYDWLTRKVRKAVHQYMWRRKRRKRVKGEWKRKDGDSVRKKSWQCMWKCRKDCWRRSGNEGTDSHISYGKTAPFDLTVLLWNLHLLVTGRNETTPFHVSMSNSSSLAASELRDLAKVGVGGRYRFSGGLKKVNCHHEMQSNLGRKGQTAGEMAKKGIHLAATWNQCYDEGNSLQGHGDRPP